MSLADPTKKMSKSDENTNAFVTILDKPEVILKKFKRAVTDSEMEVRYAEGKDGINNLMSIYSAVTGLSYEQIEKDFSGKGYGDFKTAVGEAVAEHLRPVREEYERLIQDKAYLEQCYRSGAEKAAAYYKRNVYERKNQARHRIVIQILLVPEGREHILSFSVGPFIDIHREYVTRKRLVAFLQKSSWMLGTETF